MFRRPLLIYIYRWIREGIKVDSRGGSYNQKIPTEHKEVMCSFIENNPRITLAQIVEKLHLKYALTISKNYYFTFFHPILSTLSAFRNPILTHLPLSGFLDSLCCVLIAPTPGLAFSLLMPRMPVAALSFSSDRAYPFLNFLPPLFLRSIPTLIM